LTSKSHYLGENMKTKNGRLYAKKVSHGREGHDHPGRCEVENHANALSHAQNARDMLR